MVFLAYAKVLGARVRALRELEGWSQSTAAGRLPLSQKQWSRLERGDVSDLERRILIRLAEIFDTPIATGELNEWLHAFGYRPHMVPLLSLPPNHQGLFSAYPSHPAIIVDFGRYLRYANPAMRDLYGLDLGGLEALRRNWLWQYFHPDGVLYRAYPPDAEERILNQLYWEWEPYFREAWNVTLREQLERALGIGWADLQHRYNIPSDALAGNLSESISVRKPDGTALLFQNRTVHVPRRPDLFIIEYRPTNRAASEWCRPYGEKRQHA